MFIRKWLLKGADLLVGGSLLAGSLAVDQVAAGPKRAGPKRAGPKRAGPKRAGPKMVGLLLAGLLAAGRCPAQGRIIDMYIRAYGESTFKTPATDFYGNSGSSSAELHRRETLEEFSDFHIVRAVVGGSPAAVDAWVEADGSHRIVRALAMDSVKQWGMDSEKFEALIKAGKIQVFAAMDANYGSTPLNSPGWQPYWQLCEKYDIPVAIRTGSGDPGDPYKIENLLVRYPRLRVYMMHSGEENYEHALRLMDYYPQLYTDLGEILWAEPRDQRYAIAFLKAAKQAGYLNRVLYSTDQRRWPHAMGKSLRFFKRLNFLTPKEKEEILYDNAARFLRRVPVDN